MVAFLTSLILLWAATALLPFTFSSHGADAFLILYAAALAGWALCVFSRFRPGALLLFTAAIALRVVPALSAPELSHDVYRYLWDGRVAAAGISPYALAPADPELDSLRTTWHARINHPEIRSIYPPAAQATFALTGVTSTGLTGWKVLLLIADLMTIAIIARAWGRRIAMAYGFFPLLIIEGAWNGHVEVLAVLILLLSFLALVRRNAAASGALLAVATLVKIVPVVALAVFLRYGKRRAALISSFAATVVFFTLPFAMKGAIMPGFADYAQRWSFNSPLYEATLRAVEFSRAAEWMKTAWAPVKDALRLEWISPRVYAVLYPEAVTRALLGIALLFALALVVRRSRTPGSAVASSIGALLVCSPVIHPWYWLALLPFAIRSRSYLWICLAAASPASYLLYEGTDLALVFGICYGLPVMASALLRVRILRNADRADEAIP